MTHRTNSNRLIILLTLIPLSFILHSGIALADDPENQAFVESFSKGDYPWYNAEKDEANLDIDFYEGIDAKTADRNSIKQGKQADSESSSQMKWGLFLFWLVFVMVCVGAMIALGVWLISRMDLPSNSLQGKSDLDDDAIFGSARVEKLPFEVQQASGDFRAAAENAYQAGDYRKAMTFLFSHVLLTLDKHNQVRLRRGKTNRQYLREMTPNTHASISGYYAKLMEFFESTFFGDHEIAKAQFEECWKGLPEFQNRVSQSSEVTLG